jgi:hypothetical protein
MHASRLIVGLAAAGAAVAVGLLAPDVEARSGRLVATSDEPLAVPFPAPCGKGVPLVDVTQTLLNGIDVDDTSEAWAYDRTLTSRIRFWQTGTRTFCEVRQIQGTFESIAGPSPARGGTIRAGITGTFVSIDAWTFNGEFDAGSRATHGTLATIDLGCQIFSRTQWYCPGSRGNSADSFTYYFPGGRSNTTLQSGYFLYDAGTRGRWLQLGLRSYGDIVG